MYRLEERRCFQWTWMSGKMMLVCPSLYPCDGLSFHFLTLPSVVQWTAMQPPSPPHIVLMILLILKHFHFAKIVQTWPANFSCIYNRVKLIPILVRLSVSVTLVLLCHFHFLWNVFVWSCPLNLIYMWGVWVGPYLWVPSPLTWYPFLMHLYSCLAYLWYDNWVHLFSLSVC